MVKLSDETIYRVIDILLAAKIRIENEKSPGAGTPGPQSKQSHYPKVL